MNSPVKKKSERKWKKFKCIICIPLDNQKPLIVSGYGYTEYEIRFCKICGRVMGMITKDPDNLYSIPTYQRRMRE